MSASIIHIILTINRVARGLQYPRQGITIGRTTAVTHVQGAGGVSGDVLQQYSLARRLKDKLWRNGLTARIEKISIENRGAYYRVRLGPYDRLDNLDRDNHKLIALGIHAMRLKVAKSR